MWGVGNVIFLVKFVDAQGVLQRGPQGSLTPKDTGAASSKSCQPLYVRSSDMSLAIVLLTFLAPPLKGKRATLLRLGCLNTPV